MSENAARAAAERIVDAFAHHNRERYFASFSPEATFIFHNHPERLNTRAEYEALWTAWEADGFHVESCLSENASLQLIGDTMAIFSHEVHTRLTGEDEVQHERETIVLQRDTRGQWLGVHEHLSVRPTPGPRGPTDITRTA